MRWSRIKGILTTKQGKLLEHELAFVWLVALLGHSVGSVPALSNAQAARLLLLQGEPGMEILGEEGARTGAGAGAVK